MSPSDFSPATAASVGPRTNDSLASAASVAAAPDNRYRFRNDILVAWVTLVETSAHPNIDTNQVEREIRPLAIGRTNWLFLGHERAGTTASALYTMLQSGRLQQVDLLPYLTDVLRGLPAVERGDVAGLDMYLPDRWLAAHPQHRLLERERESQDAQRRRRMRHAARRAGAAG